MTTTNAQMGLNRTGIGTAPSGAAAMVEATQEFPPSGEGDERRFSEVRTLYSEEADPMGSVPPPATLKGVLKTAISAVSGDRPAQFIDKLGERLAFERSGVRIYEALISKFDTEGEFEDGPTRTDLEQILHQEHAHFRLLATVVSRLGGDPTVVTPSANFHATMSTGIMAAVVDARTSFSQCLEAALLIELADNEGWEVLIQLAQQADEQEFVSEFEKCMLDEEEHLANVRTWVAAAQGVLGAS